jgi:AcrR family transcriptional regulator
MTKKTFADLKEKERGAKQAVIIDAAERIFGQKPFNKVSIRDIAAEAGISHATIYRYFPDQQTVFVEAFLRGVEEIHTLIDAVIKERGTTDPVASVAEAFVNFLSENDHYFRMMTHFMLDGNLSPVLLERLNAAERSILDKIETVFEGAGVAHDSRALAHAFFAALNGILISFRDYPGRDRDTVLAHMQSLARLIARLFSR